MEEQIKRILISICNSLMEMSISYMLKQIKGFEVYSAGSADLSIVEKCAAVSADILLMEIAYNPGFTLEERLCDIRNIRLLKPECKVILICDENSFPEIARKVAMAKKDRLIDDFIYSPVSDSYLLAILCSV